MEYDSICLEISNFCQKHIKNTTLKWYFYVTNLMISMDIIKQECVKIIDLDKECLDNCLIAELSKVLKFILEENTIEKCCLNS
jgi:hypothetical protein